MTSIVVVNWNSGPFLEKCVQSLRKHAGGCSVIVVDNASTDGSTDFTAETGPEVTLLRNSENTGFAAACNRGWRSVEDERILFLNPDTECLPGSVGCLEETLAADPSIRAVGGCLVSPDGLEQTGFNVRPFPTIGSVAADMFFVDEIRRFFKGGPGKGTAAGAVDVDQPAAACLMTTREALDSIGGFDETFRPAWFEDVDFCKRIHGGGGRIQFQPRARFLHHGGYSLDRMPRKDFLQSFHTNQIRYFRKHHGRPAARRVRRLITMGLLLRSAVSLAYPLIRNTSRIESAKIFWDTRRYISGCNEACL